LVELTFEHQEIRCAPIRIEHLSARARPSGLVQWRNNYGNLQQGARRHAEYVNIYEAGISDVGWIKRRRHVTITAIAIVGTLTIAMTSGPSLRRRKT
jgi:hypothetical protein